MKNKLKTKWFLLLILFAVSSCGSSCGKWQGCGTQNAFPACNSARIFLPPANEFSGLELELVMAGCELRLYLNVFGLEIAPDSCDPSTSLVYISFKDHSYTFAAPRFAGGQRLLIPNDVRDEIIKYMQEEKRIFIQVCRYEAEIFPDRFLPLFRRMMEGRRF